MPKQNSDDSLIKAIGRLKSELEIKNFLRDLLTPAEIDEFARRFKIAELLWTTKDSYAKIASQVDTSTTTVTRVARFLFQEPYQGYADVLTRLHGKSQRKSY